MNPDLAQVFAALPATGEPETEGLDARILQQLFSRLERRRTPASSLHRFGVLAGLQAQIALASVAWWVRGWFHSVAESSTAKIMAKLPPGENTWTGSRLTIE